MATLVSLLMTMTACAQTQQSKESKSENMDKGKKVLVVYFSATGTTKAVAEDLAKVMDATLFEIEPTENIRPQTLTGETTTAVARLKCMTRIRVPL